MTHFNQCSQLFTHSATEKALNEYSVIIANGENPLDTMMTMQRSLQIKLATEKPERNISPNEINTAGEAIDWMRKQWDCMSDEFRELLTSLGGMSNGEKEASGAWKDWKANNLKLRAVKLEDMSPEDKYEIVAELSDLWHFFLNMNIALGLSAEDIFTAYYIKNAENFDRQNRGY